MTTNTKYFTIVHLKNESYMIDKDAKIEAGDYVNDAFTGIKFVKNEPQAHYYETYPWVGNKILASSDKELNLPLLPTIENDWEVAYNRTFPKAYLVGEKGMKDIKDGFMEGYKANTKKWSDEDLRLVFGLGAANNANGKPSFEEVIKSLSPKPIGVEVEMEQLCHQTGQLCGYPCNGEDNCKESTYIKVDIDIFVKVVKWVYENS